MNDNRNNVEAVKNPSRMCLGLEEFSVGHDQEGWRANIPFAGKVKVLGVTSGKSLQVHKIKTMQALSRPRWRGQNCGLSCKFPNS